MNGTARAMEQAQRLALALLLALGLHAALLLGTPAEGWSLRHPQTVQFEVALLPPIAQPNLPPPITAPGPTESPAVVVPEPAPPPAEPAPVAPSAPVPVPPPPATVPPPKPAAAVRPASKPVAPAARTIKPSPVAKITPAPPVAVKPVKPVAPPKADKPAATPAKPVVSSRHKAAAEPDVKPPGVNPSPAPPFTPAETPRVPVKKPAAQQMERSGRGGVRGAGGRSGRLDSAALLGQIASLDAETQQRASRAAREQRVSLADSRSLAGFYAADWARKVTRVGETNFPDAARRLNLSTGPLLEIAIRADGSLRSVRVLRSSGNAELDSAARRIVELAAPYPPFSPELRQQVELLRIEAPWRFDPGGRVRLR